MTQAPLRLTAAALIAVAAMLPFAVPQIAGIATWKVVLGIVGLCLFVAGGRKRPNAGAGTEGPSR